MIMGETRLWPLDFASLKKGRWLDAEEVERATRVTRSDPNKYRLGMMRLTEMIVSRTSILVRSEGDRLRLMTDSEAYQWNVTQALRAEERLATSARRTTLIDRTQLSEADQVAHDQSARAIQAIAASARRERLGSAKLLGLMAEPVKEIEGRR